MTSTTTTATTKNETTPTTIPTIIPTFGPGVTETKQLYTLKSLYYIGHLYYIRAVLTELSYHNSQHQTLLRNYVGFHIAKKSFLHADTLVDTDGYYCKAGLV